MNKTFKQPRQILRNILILGAVFFHLPVFSKPSPTPTAAPTAEGAAQSQPRAGQVGRKTIRIAAVEEFRQQLTPAHFDPMRYLVRSNYFPNRITQRTLVTLDKSLQLVGDLADSWRITPNGIWFHIKANQKTAKGVLLTAQDVMKSLSRHFLFPESARIHEIMNESQMNQLKVLGDEVFVPIDVPAPLAMRTLTYVEFSIFPSRYIGENGELQQGDDFVGPYRMVSSEFEDEPEEKKPTGAKKPVDPSGPREAKSIFVRNPNYYPKYSEWDTIVYLATKKTSSELSNSADIAYTFDQYSYKADLIYDKKFEKIWISSGGMARTMKIHDSEFSKHTTDERCRLAKNLQKDAIEFAKNSHPDEAAKSIFKSSSPLFFEVNPKTSLPENYIPKTPFFLAATDMFFLYYPTMTHWVKNQLPIPNKNYELDLVAFDDSDSPDLGSLYYLLRSASDFPGIPKNLSTFLKSYSKSPAAYKKKMIEPIFEELFNKKCYFVPLIRMPFRIHYHPNVVIDMSESSLETIPDLRYIYLR